jgi:hypothetical protein
MFLFIIYLKRIHNNTNNTSSIELLNGQSNKQKTCMTVHIIQQGKQSQDITTLNVTAHTGITLSELAYRTGIGWN